MDLRDVHYVIFAISLLNSLLHETSFFLLLRIYRKEQGSKTQQLCLINLSAVELVKNLFFLVDTICMLVPVHSKMYGLVALVVRFCLLQLIVLAMFLITGDRLAATLLDVSYTDVCTLRTVKAAIICSWSTCVFAVPTLFATLCFFSGYEVTKEAVFEADRVIIPIIHALFFIFASVSISMIQLINNSHTFISSLVYHGGC